MDVSNYTGGYVWIEFMPKVTCKQSSHWRCIEFALKVMWIWNSKWRSRVHNSHWRLMCKDLTLKVMWKWNSKWRRVYTTHIEGHGYHSETQKISAITHCIYPIYAIIIDFAVCHIYPLYIIMGLLSCVSSLQYNNEFPIFP